MASLNKVILTGNLAKDMEVSASGKSGRLTIAQNIWDGQEDKANFFNVMLLGEKTIDRAKKILNKGANITIDGSIENNNWEDKDGNKHYDLSIKTFDFFVNRLPNRDETQHGVSESSPKEEINDDPIDLSDIPF